MPTRNIVQVHAPSRLHFGMFSFGQNGIREFGGAGAMIVAPGLKLRITPADRLTATGPVSERALRIAEQLLARTPKKVSGTFSIEVLSAPREHVGLGVGTQLALAVAAGIRRWFGDDDLPATELAAMVGRAKRSAVGTYGFAQGGLIVEAGKHEDERFSPLLARVTLPEAWRFVLFIPKRAAGLSGAQEGRAFAELPPVPIATTAELTREALEQLVPAAVQGNFDAFSESLYRFNHLAGQCFASQQYGAYADEHTSNLVGNLRGQGICGVGQTSWGPTVFALQPDEQTAQRVVQQFRDSALADRYDLVVTAIANHGASVRVE